MKKRNLVFVLAASMVVGNAVTVFAEEAVIPVKINKEATAYNVTVSEALALDFQGAITASGNIDVTNNSPVGVIDITNIDQITAGNDGWTVHAVETEDYWKKLQINSKQFGLQYNGDTVVDLSATAATATPLKAVNPTATEQLAFTAFAGGTTEEVTAAHITDVVITLGFNTAATVSVSE